jgi:hypothetical protein
MSEYALYEIVEVERLREELVKTKRLFTGCAKEIDRLAGRLEQEEEMRVAAESKCEELEQQLREAEAREAVLRGAIFEAMGIGLLMDDYNTTCKHCLKEPNCTHEKGDCPLDRLNKILQAPAPDVNPCGSCACTEICKDRAEKERKLTAENRALREALERIRAGCGVDRNGCYIRSWEVARDALKTPAPAERLTSIRECDCEDCKALNKLGGDGE